VNPTQSTLHVRFYDEKVVFETRNRLRARETENDKVLDHLMDLIS